MAKTKGFRFNRHDDESVLLSFDVDHDLHGLEIRVRRRIPVGWVIAATRQEVGEAARLFASQVIGWNVEDADGRAVAPTVEAFGEYVSVQDLNAIMEAWTTALTGTDAPLEQPSAGGAAAAG
jgi:hypothetical protein